MHRVSTLTDVGSCKKVSLCSCNLNACNRPHKSHAAAEQNAAACCKKKQQKKTTATNVDTVWTHRDMIECFTLKPGMGLGLVGDGVEDFVDLEAEIWPLEIPFTARRETETKTAKRNSAKRNSAVMRYKIYCFHRFCLCV